MKRFYVYELIDPRTGEVFYVGKGQRKRVDQHEADAKAGGVSAKCERIREIWADHRSVKKRIVERFELETDAYAFEAQHMAVIGRENLLNIRDGGLGGRIKSAKEIAVEEMAALLGYIAIWAKAGCVKTVSLGRLGVLDVESIMQGYKARVLAYAEVIGRDAAAVEAKAHGINLRFE